MTGPIIECRGRKRASSLGFRRHFTHLCKGTCDETNYVGLYRRGAKGFRCWNRDMQKISARGRTDTTSRSQTSNMI